MSAPRATFPSHAPRLERLHRPFWVATKFADIQPWRGQNTLLPERHGPVADEECACSSKSEAGTGAAVPQRCCNERVTYWKYRQCLTQAWFVRRTYANRGAAAQLARPMSTSWLQPAARCDFVSEIAVHYPLMVICRYLGVRTKTNRRCCASRRSIRQQRAELNRGKAAMTPLEAEQAVTKVVSEFNDYFRKVSRTAAAITKGRPR